MMLFTLLLISICCHLSAANAEESYNVAQNCLDSLIRPRDCFDIKYFCPTARSGVYLVFPHNTEPGFLGVQVSCDMTTEGGGWTTFQRRQDGSVDFERNFEEYTNGFGDLSGEFWIGLDNLHLFTYGRRNTLRIDMKDYDDFDAYATYQNFYIGEGDNYTLNFDEDSFFGDAGDSLSYHQGMSFSTADVDQDMWSSNCAESDNGGFWFNSCTNTNPNGLYGGKDISGGNYVCWYGFRVQDSLKKFEMKFRPNY